ncbi:hypothetical protein [Brachybacterium alimentarium]|uniref:hypothetical protein n=1 Tax=Brachybacterium alimentarium TaxID=47845 RepID=UPI003FD3E0AB
MPTAPVLDHEALRSLGEELGDSDIFCGFLRRYVALLDQRLERLEHALGAADHDEWMDAVLSLQTSSVQAGARALAEQAADLQRDSAPCPSWAAAPRYGAAHRARRMTGLHVLAVETAHQLRVVLQQVGGAPRPRS